MNLSKKRLFVILALFVLIIFYGIYFSKKFIQKKQGIQTRQIGKRKEKNIHTVEMFMSIATLVIVIVQLASIIFNWNIMNDEERYIGFVIGIIGDLVFLISVICMKDSWRAGIPDKDKTKLVTDGIYKYSRNPAFLGFDLMYIGILLIFFNPLNLIFSIFAIVMLHLQILQEEKYLSVTFGEEYLKYKQNVHRYFGRSK